MNWLVQGHPAYSLGQGPEFNYSTTKIIVVLSRPFLFKPVEFLMD